MEVNFLNRYLYSPTIWLHYTNSKLKIYTILIFLFIINYINSKYLIILFLVYITVFRKLNIPERYSISLPTTLLFLTFSYSLNYLIAKQDINFTSHLHICIPYITAINYLPEKKKKIPNNTITLIYSKYCLPNFILRVYILNVLNLLLTNALFVTTLYEDIILLITNLKKNHSYKKNIIIIACTSQFLEEIIAHFYKLFIIIKIRSYSICILHILILDITKNLINFISKYIDLLSISINLRLNIKDV